ncbi:uncharacterized protein LOC135209089 isoform X1 [Macrobrachium nipponense]|uniref:uncharacterized protein LOC135209089 isoform X1 n=2 Tax=Macrobrachium nipponense TaxID=159736 RepID=UPI0030C8BCA6
MAGPETHAAVASAEDPTMLLYLTVVVGATVIVLVWLFRRGRHEGAGPGGGQGGAEKQTGDKKSTGDNSASKKGMTKVSKKKVTQDWKKVPPPTSYTHPELITSLKGHTGNITSGSYSANGKHFISAADAGSGRRFDPGGRGVGKAEFYSRQYTLEDCLIGSSISEGSSSVEELDTSSVSSSSQVATSNAPSDTEDILTSSSNGKMSRRQRKNKNKKFKNSSGCFSTSKMVSQSTKELFNSIGRTEEEIYNLLLPLCSVVEERVLNGYPYVTNQGVHVFKTSGYSTLAAALNGCELVHAELNRMQHFDVQKKVDVDGASSDYSEPESVEDLSTGDGFHEDCQDTSSGVSSDCKENDGDGEGPFSSDMNMNYCRTLLIETSGSNESKREVEKCVSGDQSVEKCKRCRQNFIIGNNGMKPCEYHPKKLVLRRDGRLHYQCCNRMKGVEGCTRASFHVYHNLRSGLNGPLEGYVSSKEGRPRVIGIDCEMVFTTKGFELARVTLVSVSGRVLLDSYVRPEGAVFDYNTQFSGITANHIEAAPPFHEVREKILSCVSSSSILVGHSLEGDLSAIRLVHRNVIDTSLIFKGPQTSQSCGPIPHKQSLKSLAKRHLGRDIQKGGSKGHDSLEDATAALDLVLRQLKESRCDDALQSLKVAPLPLALKNM